MYQQTHVNRGLFITLAFALAAGCSQKKLIVLPDKGDRTIVFTESGDTLKITNKTITITHMPLIKNGHYQGDIGINHNYAGSFETKKYETKMRSPLSNVIIHDGILYYTHQNKIQRYDLKHHKTRESLPFTLTSPTILNVHDNIIALVTEGAVTVYDLKKKKTLLEQTTSELITKRPLIVKEKLFVQTQADEIICFDLTSSKEVWRYTHSKHDTYIFQNDYYAGMATWDNTIIFVTATGDIVVLDRDTKEPYWVYPSVSLSELTLNVPFTPIVDGDLLYLAKKDTGLLCLNLKERTLVWQRPSIQTIVQPSIYGGYVFVASGKTVIAVDQKTGTALYRTKALPEIIVSALFVQNNHLIVAGKTKIFRLSLATGDLVSETSVSHPSLQHIFPYQSGCGVISNDRIELN